MAYNWDNDYYTNKYINKKSKYYDSEDKYYSNNDSYSSKWNWGNYGSYTSSYLEEDDDKGLYIKNHESYFTPKTSDFEKKLSFKSNTKANRDLIKEMSRFFYYKMLEDTEYFDDKFKNTTKLKKEEVENYEIKKSYYQELWDKDIPGYSPLEKSLFVFSQLQKDNPDKTKYDATLIKSTIEGIKVDMEAYADPIYNELLDMNEFSKNKKFSILDKISMIKNLGSEFKIQKEKEEKIVANSNIIVKKIMRDYSQIFNLELYQRLMPDFPIKLLTKNLIVNVPVDRTDHKQKIIFLLDFSGSMSGSDKQDWVNALLIDRLRYCIKEEAEVFFSYFVEDTKKLNFIHIYDRKSAIAFWSTFSNSPNGGTTKMGDIVNYIKLQIQVRNKLHNLDIDLSLDKPEILIINDGQDSVQTNKFTYKTNAITLVDSENDELKKLCLETKGKYVYINKKETRLYSENGGNQILKN